MADDPLAEPDVPRSRWEEARLFVAEALRPDVVRRSTKVALGVGTVLAVVNHGGALVALDVPPTELVQIAVTYLVPFAVAAGSAAAQSRASARAKGDR